MFEIWTIDKKITNIDGSHNLEKRTKVPLELTEAHAVALKYSRLGHIIEYRKVAQRLRTVFRDSYECFGRPQPPHKCSLKSKIHLPKKFFG